MLTLCECRSSSVHRLLYRFSWSTCAEDRGRGEAAERDGDGAVEQCGLKQDSDARIKCCRHVASWAQRKAGEREAASEGAKEGERSTTSVLFPVSFLFSSLSFYVCAYACVCVCVCACVCMCVCHVLGASAGDGGASWLCLQGSRCLCSGSALPCCSAPWPLFPASSDAPSGGTARLSRAACGAARPRAARTRL